MSTQPRTGDRVVLCVFDGLRPDFVSPELTPNLARFAGQGTWFRQARSVFPSMTRVATTSIATGTTPRYHGVVGNAFYFSDVTREHVLDMSRADDIRLAEQATQGGLVGVASFGDVLAKAGKKLAVVHTGSAGSAHLINPRAHANGHWTFSIMGREHTQTPDAVDEVVARFGPLPPRTLPRFAEVDYAEQVFREHVLGGLDPDVALIWFNEPDTSFHYRFLGSPETLQVLKAVDAAFGRILAWIDARPDRDRYMVMVASDHGQISMNDALPLCDLLGAQGHQGRRAAERVLTGASFAMTGGNMGELRILEGGHKRRDAIAAWLQEQEFLGMLFSPGRNELEGQVPGSFALSLVELDHPRQDGLVFVLRSCDAPDAFGYPGLGMMTVGDVSVGGGMHGGLNRHELNTMLAARGGDFEAGQIDHSACGIIDIAPTLLSALGLQPAATMTGRCLSSALQGDPQPRQFTTGLGGFRQTLDVVARERSSILLAGGRG